LPSPCEILRNFTEDILRMKEKSEREGREYAVAICKVNDNYLLGEMIAGREHEIAVISRCESGDRVGIIHTFILDVSTPNFHQLISCPIFMMISSYA